MRALTGALTVWVAWASRICCWPSGSMSQKVRVKSKGEFWIAQKLL